VVEDERRSVRTVMVCVLERQGYRVLQAGSCKEAEEVCRWHSARIDLLLTDDGTGYNECLLETLLGREKAFRCTKAFLTQVLLGVFPAP